MSNSVTKLFLVVQWLCSTDFSFCDHIPLKLVWLRSNGCIPGFKTRAIKAQNCQLIIEGFPLSVPLLRSTNTELLGTQQDHYQGGKAGIATSLPALDRYESYKMQTQRMLVQAFLTGGFVWQVMSSGQGGRFLNNPYFGKQGAGFLSC